MKAQYLTISYKRFDWSDLPEDYKDLINKSHSGLIKSKNVLENLDEIKIVEFDHTDVVRHPLVSKIIKAYQKKIDE